jgi:hypothetical protein
MGGISLKFSVSPNRDHARKINSPSRSPEYFRRFHKPLVEEVLSMKESAVVLDVACGHAHELKFFEDPRLVIFGVDVSQPTLDSARRDLPSVIFMHADVRHGAFLSNTIDIGIAVNAVVYVPDAMLGFLRASLVTGGRAAVNFRDASNPLNKPFFDHFLVDGGSVSLSVLKVAREEFQLRVLDYNLCNDMEVRNLGRQVFLQSVDDMVRLMDTVGLNVISHEQFRFASPANPENELDVFIVEK